MNSIAGRWALVLVLAIVPRPPAVAAAVTPQAQTDANQLTLREEICTRCTIRLEVRAQIDRTVSPFLSDQAIIAVAPSGAVYATDPKHLGKLLEFTSSGRFRRSIRLTGISDAGMPVFDHRGNVVIPEERSGQIHVIDTAGTVRHQFSTVDYPADLTFLGSSRIVVNAHSRTLQRHRYALHTLMLGDTVVRSFDRFQDRVLNPADGVHMWRRLWPHDSEHVWSAHVTKYRIDLWNTTTGLQRSYARSVPWFAGPYERVAWRQTPPSTELRGIFEDDGGLLWLVIAVADANWQGFDLPVDGMARTARGDYPGLYRHLNRGVWDTIIEVVDPARSTVVASRRFDEEMSGFVGSGHLIRYVSETNETGVYQVIRVALEGR